MNTCWMCIWHMFDRLMLTNVHWLVLHDWIKPAGWKQPDSKFIYKGRRALTQQKINKVRLHQYHIMYNRSFSNNLNFFHWKNSTMCKQNLAVSLFSTLKNQYQGLMKNVIDRPCHQGSFQNLNLTLNDLKNDLPLVLVQLESIFEFLKIVKIFCNQLKVSAEFRKTRERYRRWLM